MSAYVLQLDARHFFPGTWDKMTPAEQAEWQARMQAIQMRQKDNVKAIPGGGNTREAKNFVPQPPAVVLEGECPHD